MRSLVLIYICCLMIVPAAFAQRLATVMPMPTNVDKVDFFLLPADLGDEIYTRGGHTMLRVVDHVANTDWDFNWGTFDFDDPAFLPKFLKGVLPYSLDIVSHSLVS